MNPLRPTVFGSSLLVLASIAAFATAACSDDANDAPSDPNATRDAGATGTSDAANNPGNSTGSDRPDAAVTPPDASPAAVAPDAVYTLSNETAGNRVHVYARAATGELAFAASYPTGGKGTGEGLGDQGALVFDAAANRFFAVNAGDDTVSMLSLETDGKLVVASTVASGGAKPISVTFSGDVVYVANFGDATRPSNVSGFRVTAGELVAIPGSTRPLSAAMAEPAQVQFTPAADAIVVTEKATNTIDSFPVANGLLGAVSVKASEGMTPFGFEFGPGPTLLVSEAFGGMPGATSSYKVGPGGALTTASASVKSTQSAPCWVAVTGSHAYVTNTASMSVTGYTVAPDGTITLDDPSGVAGTTQTKPIDEAITRAGDLLYVLNSLDGKTHSFSVFKIAPDGKLTKVTDVTGQATTGVGLVVR